MMFGFRDTFVYLKCSSCGALQLSQVPENLQRYYPPQYYSFAEARTSTGYPLHTRILRAIRDHYALWGRNPVGSLIYRRYPYPELRSLSRIRRLSRKARILDVGSGSGLLLDNLHRRGFQSVVGIDPYIDRDIEYPSGARVFKRTLDRVEGTWDLVMFHHSFEHAADPLQALAHARELLAKDGACLLRMPVVPSAAWEEYGVDWVGLDAPRHLCVHSVESVRRIADRAGMTLQEVVYDSSELQFVGSEQYRRDIPLLSDRSFVVDPSRSIFAGAEIRAFRKRARELNEAKRGDQAAFYLYPRG